MQITLKTGSVVTLPWIDSADVSSNNSAIGITAGPNGGIVITATQPGRAVVTVRFNLLFSAVLAVEVVA